MLLGEVVFEGLKFPSACQTKDDIVCVKPNFAVFYSPQLTR